MKRKRRPVVPWLTEAALFALLFAVCLLLAFRMNFKDGKPAGNGVFASDKSIYYVYLPATFIYGWDVNRFPHRCDTLYRGFILDYKKGKVVNKMTCGVAILWTPFFLATHTIAKVFALQPDGFSLFYQKMALIPPVFFLLLGLFFLRRFLGRYFTGFVPWAVVLTVFTATNLWYFSLAEGLMSHVHSFFLFALFLYLLKRFIDGESRSYRLFAWLCLVFALAVLIRPTNVIITLWFLLLDVKTGHDVLRRLRILLRPSWLLTFLGVTFLVLLPQMIYWKYVSGHFLHYSYGNEGFINWKNPVILPVWFSPFNGLFAYNPAVLFFVAGALWMVFRRKQNGRLIVLTFLLVTYMAGSWHMWFFGGSYGARPFIEYYTLLSVGLGWMLTWAFRHPNHLYRATLLLMLVGCSWFNLRMIDHNYWYNGSTWDWDEYRTRVEKAGILQFDWDRYTCLNDYENMPFDPSLTQTSLRVHSRTQAAVIDNRWPFTGLLDRPLQGMVDHPPRHVEASVWINPVWRDSTGAVLVASVEDDSHEPCFYRKVPVNRFGTSAGQWTKASLAFDIPSWLSDPAFRLKIYLWNRERRTMYIDDVKVVVE
ncbi:MAG TPA: hypothetical protein PKG48_06370 [Bacteroidales bacterium]|nr:hypothetical protein [Bacteroidales bacterium]